MKQLETGEVNVEELKRNLEYAASLLEAVYIDETRWGQGDEVTKGGDSDSRATP